MLDPHGSPVPAGVAGELHLGGAGLARGYLGRPESTAAAWVPHPFAGEPGARLYRTGDRARWRADGALEFLGRVDQQLKVRGFRIEPGEIEAALLEHPAVAAAAVAARRDAAGDAQLAAYVVAAGDAAPGAAELRAWLRERLPEHMVPSAFVAMERLPLGPSGKLDRRALPAPEEGALEPGTGADHVPPRDGTEAEVARVWAEVLELEPARVGARDGFFESGGHSLRAMLAGVAAARGARRGLRAAGPVRGAHRGRDRAARWTPCAPRRRPRRRRSSRRSAARGASRRCWTSWRAWTGCRKTRSSALLESAE